MCLGQEWKIERHINNAPPIYGTVKVTAGPTGKHLWHEIIQTPLETGEHIEGEQKYEIMLEGKKLSIYHATGQQPGTLFQSFDLNDEKRVSLHLCGSDKYESTLKCVSDKEVHVCHVVTGPKKDYRMKTIYRKIH